MWAFMWGYNWGENDILIPTQNYQRNRFSLILKLVKCWAWDCAHTHMHAHVSLLGDLIPAGDHWTLNPVLLLRDKAGGWGPTLARHTALVANPPPTPPPHPDGIKGARSPEVVQSHPELHQVRNANAVVSRGSWWQFGGWSCERCVFVYSAPQLQFLCPWIWQSDSYSEVLLGLKR